MKTDNEDEYTRYRIPEYVKGMIWTSFKEKVINFGWFERFLSIIQLHLKEHFEGVFWNPQVLKTFSNLATQNILLYLYLMNGFDLGINGSPSLRAKIGLLQKYPWWRNKIEVCE